MIGIRYHSLSDLNSQAHAWCEKVNRKPHGTTGIPPLDRLAEENLSPLRREYIIDRINLRRVEKDCLISYAGNKYSVPAEYVGKDVAVMVLDHMLAAYYEGKQIALHRLSYGTNKMTVNREHYQLLTTRQSFDIENTLMNGRDMIDTDISCHSLSQYDVTEEGGRYE